MKTGYAENNNREELNGASIRLSAEEREIVLVMNDKDRTWEASCSSPTYMRKFERQGWECFKTENYKDGTVCTKFYRAPTKSAITIGKANRPKKVMSEEHKKKLIESRAKNRENK